jgi:3-hydroxyacyl-[acyl-carrier-protein] dehydratase
MEISGAFFFDPEDLIYHDHFPGNPTVPGTQIVRAFIEYGRKMVPSAGNFTIDNFKFRQFIKPGEYRYRMRLMPGFLVCELLDGENTVASGRLRL